jgi:glucose-1-phosphate adenylyltransferase
MPQFTRTYWGTVEMKIRAIILAGGEGTRLSVLTAKRTKPAVPFGGKYRIIDFSLSNCINSNIFDIMIIAQYRPHSLLDHIGAGGPWDLNREISGGVKIFTPYRAMASGWFRGTADAVQQNFSFIKRGNPDHFLILSGDHIYNMNYAAMVAFHQSSQADVTIATLEVPIEEASRFGILEVDEQQKIVSFKEKPQKPTSNLANMGVYVFSKKVLDKVLWEDHLKQDSSHDFGNDILPDMIQQGYRLVAYPYKHYWVDVGTVDSYWQAHMDLLAPAPQLNLYNQDWKIYTREEIYPPALVHPGARLENSLICNGCIIHKDAHIVNSILSPGVQIESGASINHSIVLTESKAGKNSRIDHAVLDKRVRIEDEAMIGSRAEMDTKPAITMIGKNSIVATRMTVESGATIGNDVVPLDYSSAVVHRNDRIQTRRLPNEV